MDRKHSWSWLPSRNPRVRPANPSLAGESRPPLTMEPLEDRVLLSATLSEGEQGILIGLLRNQIGLRSAELGALKLAGEMVGDKQSPLANAFVKIEDDFLQLDQAIWKLADGSVFQGDKLSPVGWKLEVKGHIDAALADLDLQVKLFGEGENNALLPAVQKVREAANRALNGLTETTVKLDAKFHSSFLQIENEFLKIELVTDKWTTDDLAQKLNKGQDDNIDQKLAIEFKKLDNAFAAMGDGSVFKALSDDLAALKIQTVTFVDTFGQKGGGDIVTTPTVTDQIL